MKEQADIGMIGLAVMGENLSLNIESRGFTVALFNRTVPGLEEGVVLKFVNGRGRGKNFIGTESIEDLVKALAAPRRIMMMVKAVERGGSGQLPDRDHRQHSCVSGRGR